MRVEMPALTRSGLDRQSLSLLIRSEAALFAPLTGASILLSGATGWFGTWLLDSLMLADEELDLHLRITAISRNPGVFLNRFPAFSGDQRLSWIKTDIRHVKGSVGNFSFVIHGAADNMVPPGIEAQTAVYNTIVDGTKRLVDLTPSDCKGFLFLSSGAVYESIAEGEYSATEVSPLKPLGRSTDYATGKRMAELMLEEAATSGFPSRIARCFAFVGPHMPFDSHFAIGNFIADAVSGRAIRVQSDGAPRRSFLYMNDLLTALLVILTKGTSGRSYNVGSDIPVTIKELAVLVNKVLAGNGVEILGARSSCTDHYVPDTTRLRHELGWAAKYELPEAIEQTAAWYQTRLRKNNDS